ncbi:MAG: hypothetical protein FWG69_03700 [Oscillospiraceae bacterium]|nr:hypothetical protein [Oscillospiraceae bacterium]
MWFYVVAGFILFAAALGFADIIAFIEQKLVCSHSEKKAVVVLPLKGHVENAESILRGAVTAFKYQSPDYATVFVIDLGVSEETRKICSLFEDETPTVVMCKQDEFDRMLGKEQLKVGHGDSPCKPCKPYKPCN